jgi:serine/threonine protein kinase
VTHPPLLLSHTQRRQRTGAPFSKLFEDFIKKALSKAPSQRASATELLKHKFLKGRTRDALVHQLLDQIPAVLLLALLSPHSLYLQIGTAEYESSPRMPPPLSPLSDRCADPTGGSGSSGHSVDPEVTFDRRSLHPSGGPREEK